MKHLNFFSKSSSRSCGHSSVTLASTVGSPSAHRRGMMLRLLSVLVLILTIGVGDAWGAPVVLFHETFGAGSTSGTQAWSHSNGSQAGVDAVMANAGLTSSATNAKQSKQLDANNYTTGAGASLMGNAGSTSAAVTATYIVGPLVTTNCSDMVVSFAVKYGSVGASYFSNLYYSTNNSDWNKITTTGGPTTANTWGVKTSSSTIPAVSTIWFKIEYSLGKKGGNPYIDEFDLSGTYSATPEPSYTISAASNNESYGTVSLEGSVITGSPKSGYRYASPAYTVTSGTATVSQSDNAFTVNPSTNCTVTINFEPIPTHKISFNTGGLVDIADATGIQEGAVYNITQTPAASLTENCEYGTFVGWTTASSIADASVSPSIITSYTMSTSDVTLHAVYSKTESSGSTTTNTVTETFANQTSHSSENNWQQELSWPTLESNASIAWTTYFGKITSGYTEIRTYRNGTMGWLCSGAITGLKKVKFKGWHVNADDAADMVVSYSTNGGTSWTELGTHTATANNSSESDEYEITNSNPSTSYLLKIALSDATCPSSSNKKYRIDDIVITTESAAPDVTTYSLDANCCNPLGQINGSFFWTTHF